MIAVAPMASAGIAVTPMASVVFAVPVAPEGRWVDA
jgi:hypothetical protein